MRVVIGGAPLLRGTTMAEKRAEFLAEHDWVRQSLMFEPRGHDIMSGSILYPSLREDCDIGWIFIEVSGCLPMCGHGTIGTITTAIEHGLAGPRTPGRLAAEVPAGRIEVEYTLSSDGRFVDSVRLYNVPAYLHARDVVIDVPGLGRSRSTLPMAAISTLSLSRRRTGRGSTAWTRRRSWRSARSSGASLRSVSRRFTRRIPQSTA